MARGRTFSFSISIKSPFFRRSELELFLCQLADDIGTEVLRPNIFNETSLFRKIVGTS